MIELVLVAAGSIILALVAALVGVKRRAGRAQDQRDAAVERAVEAEVARDQEVIADEHEDARSKSGSAWFDSWTRKRSD